MTTLGQFGVKAVESRGISAETAVRLNLFTGSSVDGAVVPDQNGNIVVFPFWERGSLVAEKYRAAGKRFWQKAGGRRTFWNSDALDDPALASGHQALIITEGEIDALTAIDCGFPLSVSVPDGAPAVRDGERPDDLAPIDTAGEGAGKFEFLWNNRERLKPIKRFIIAVDGDAPGQRLAAELVRRLSAARCAFIVYPEDCKDLNDVLQKHGRESVVRVLNENKPYPVRGLYRLSDYPDAKPLQTLSTGWQTIDAHFRPFAGEFMVVTGIPSHGKSTWVMNLLVRLAEQYGWRTAVFTPEMPLMPFMRAKLRKIIGGERQDADQFIDDAFLWIDTDPTGSDSDDDFDLEWLIERATDAVLRYGIRCFLIDPWNEVEHARGRNETVTDYIGRSIRRLKRFARQYDVAVIVIAHPTKDVNDKGSLRAPTMYDIEGSASWFNKADHGICVHRPDPHSDEVLIKIQKVRFEETGEKGEVRMKFDRTTQRYHMLDGVEHTGEFNAGQSRSRSD